MFKTWIETNPSAVHNIDPKLGLRSWKDLTVEERQLFLDQIKSLGWFIAEGRLLDVMQVFNLRWPKQGYGINTLSNPTNGAADADADRIFTVNEEDVVYDFISVYAKDLLVASHLASADKATDDYSYEFHVNKAFEGFDAFAECLNILLQGFELNVQLTRRGLAPVQSKEISEELYKPVIEWLSDPRWKPSQDILAKAFGDFRNKDWSGAITKSVSALETLLQIQVHNQVGKDVISDLLRIGKERKILSDRPITSAVVRLIENALATLRRASSDAHAKLDDPNREDALLVMNLVIVLMHYCLASFH